ECRRGQPLWPDRKSRQPNSNTRKQYRVGENVDTEEIDEDRGVADPGCRYVGIIPFQRFWLGESRSDRAPTFDCPFAPKMATQTTHTRGAQSWLFGYVRVLPHA